MNFFGNRNDSWIWILVIIVLLFGTDGFGNNCGCNNNCGCGGCNDFRGDNDCCCN